MRRGGGRRAERGALARGYRRREERPEFDYFPASSTFIPREAIKEKKKNQGRREGKGNGALFFYSSRFHTKAEREIRRGRKEKKESLLTCACARRQILEKKGVKKKGVKAGGSYASKH